ncbi:O78 family O-antigen flippase [Escherichia coli]|uniref:O78 family O-antigen flippase n=1 Tax=Escherichia coli TaxID=562 RepID=UPI00335BE287
MRQHRKLVSYAVIITFLFIPIQVILSLIFNYYLAKNVALDVLNAWYMFFALISLFSLLEFSYPILAINFFNSYQGNCKGALSFFIKKSLGVVIPLQIIFVVIYSLFVNPLFIYFGMGLVVRSISNIINACVYAKQNIIIDKVYRFLYAIIMPTAFLFLFYHSDKNIDLYDLTLVWFLSSLFCLIYSLSFLLLKHKKSVNRSEKSFHLPFKYNLKLFFTVFPAIFIYTLSIYYLKIFGSESSSSSTIIYGFFLQIFNVYNLIIILVASYLMPTLSKRFHDGVDVIPLTLKLLDISVLISVISTSFVALLGIPVAEYILKGKIDVISYYYIVAIIIIFYIETCQVILTSIGTAIGIYDFHRQSIISAVMVLILSCFLIPHYNAEGLMYSIIISQFFTCFIYNPKRVINKIGFDKVNYIKRLMVHFLFMLTLIFMGLYFQNDDILPRVVILSFITLIGVCFLYPNVKKIIVDFL